VLDTSLLGVPEQLGVAVADERGQDLWM